MGSNRKDVAKDLRPTAQSLGQLAERIEVEGLDARDTFQLRGWLRMASNFLSRAATFLDGTPVPDIETPTKPRKNPAQVSQGKESTVSDAKDSPYSKTQVSPH